jgi:hypothetical protein
MIEASAFECVVHFARAVGGDNDNRRLRRFHGPQLRHCHLEVGQHLEQEGFKGLIGTVDFIDQQNRSARRVRFERLQQRTLDQESFGKNVMLDPRTITFALCFG